MKKLTLLLLGVLISTALLAQWEVDHKYGFKVNVPNGWTKNIYQDGSDMVYDFTSNDGNIFTEIRAFEGADGLTEDMLAEAFESTFTGKWNRVAFEPTELNGLNGKIAVYTANMDGMDVEIGMFYLITKQASFMIWALAEAGKLNEYSGRIDEIWNSFQLTGAAIASQNTGNQSGGFGAGSSGNNSGGGLGGGIGGGSSSGSSSGGGLGGGIGGGSSSGSSSGGGLGGGIGGGTSSNSNNNSGGGLGGGIGGGAASNSGFEIRKVTMCENTNPDSSPRLATTTFYSYSPKICAAIKADGSAKNLTIRWVYKENDYIINESLYDISEGWGVAEISKPNNGWPAGTYYVEILSNGQSLKVVPFKVIQ